MGPRSVERREGCQVPLERSPLYFLRFKQDSQRVKFVRCEADLLVVDVGADKAQEKLKVALDEVHDDTEFTGSIRLLLGFVPRRGGVARALFDAPGVLVFDCVRFFVLGRGLRE